VAGLFGVAMSFSYRMRLLQPVVCGLNARATDATRGSRRFFRDAVDVRRYDPDTVFAFDSNIGP